ncbi:MAG TPA: hypothetical protein VGO00_00460, partial [Kofleriaceae bacterium]|nr:hypothetical protein [Kofleriaceae bacterium]
MSRNIAIIIALVACSSPASRPAPPVEPTPAPPSIEPPADRTPPGLRLKTNVMPLRARVDMTLAPSKDETTASIEFDVEMHDVGRVIWLNAIDLHVTSATLEVNGATTPLTILMATSDNVGFEAPHAIPNGTGKLHVAYTGTVSPKEHTGLFREQDG